MAVRRDIVLELCGELVPARNVLGKGLTYGYNSIA